jgi:hypothetical protein
MQGVPDLRLDRPRETTDLEDWLNHWSPEHQNNLAQRFFSFYRKAVFSRTVNYFCSRYFPDQGVFIEAGSGTSETSMRINKNWWDRSLVAVDIFLPILMKVHPVMDLKICGDFSTFPSRTPVDGLWTWRMEHFTHSQIDQIPAEFHRVLKGVAAFFMAGKVRSRAENASPPEKSHPQNKRIPFSPPEISQQIVTRRTWGFPSKWFSCSM